MTIYDEIRAERERIAPHDAVWRENLKATVHNINLEFMIGSFYRADLIELAALCVAAVEQLDAERKETG